MKVTVLIDSREQKPLKFPATLKWYRDRGSKGQIVIVRSKRGTLLAGDYTLEGFEDRCIIERKGSLRELSTNLLGEDYARAMTAFERLSNATAHPYLLVECTTAELRTRTQYVHEPARVVDSLCSLMERLRFRLILCGKCVDVKQKRTVGELMLRLMLAHAYQQEPDYGGVDEVLTKLRQGPARGAKEDRIDNETRERED